MEGKLPPRGRLRSEDYMSSEEEDNNNMKLLNHPMKNYDSLLDTTSWQEQQAEGSSNVFVDAADSSTSRRYHSSMSRHHRKRSKGGSSASYGSYYDGSDIPSILECTPQVTNCRKSSRRASSSAAAARPSSVLAALPSYPQSDDDDDVIDDDISLASAAARKDSIQTIRFKVVVWNIGKLDMVQGRVPVTFRITLYWNDQSSFEDEAANDDVSAQSSSRGGSSRGGSDVACWKMDGRGKAVQTESKDSPLKTVQVPPLSILNVENFTVVGEPQVGMLRADDRLMRWTCMYRGTLTQEHWRVDQFPHDSHEIRIKLAILANRRSGGQWDRDYWKLALATRDDVRLSSKGVPHGFVVNGVSIPEFSFSKRDGLGFDFCPLDHHGGDGDETAVLTGGIREHTMCGADTMSVSSLPTTSAASTMSLSSTDEYLQVKLRVLRDSVYYDHNIMPLIGMLNLVAICITLLEPEDFFQRALLIMNIAFVEIGIRMTTDAHLPRVSYQIKMQRLLNEYFYGLLLLVMESMLVYQLDLRSNHVRPWIKQVDVSVALSSFVHNVYTQVSYYLAARRVRQHVLHDKREGGQRRAGLLCSSPGASTVSSNQTGQCSSLQKFAYSYQ